MKTFDHLWWYHFSNMGRNVDVHDNSLSISSLLNHLNFIPELSPDFATKFVHLLVSTLHEITDILHVALYYYFNIFLTLV